MGVRTYKGFDDIAMAGVVAAKEVVLAILWMTCNGWLWLWGGVPRRLHGSLRLLSVRFGATRKKLIFFLPLHQDLHIGGGSVIVSGQCGGVAGTLILLT